MRSIVALFIMMFGLSGCFLTAQTQPYDKFSEEKLTGLSIAYQKNLDAMEEGYKQYLTAYSKDPQKYQKDINALYAISIPASEYVTYKGFYDQWRAVLRHLVARSQIYNTEKSCLFVKQVATAEAYLANKTGDVAKKAFDYKAELLKPYQTSMDRVAKGYDKLKKAIEKLQKKIDTTKGDATLAKVEELKTKLARLMQQEAILKSITTSMQKVRISVPEGNCETIAMAFLEKTFLNFENFHKANKNIGIKDRHEGLPALLTMQIRNALRIQIEKKIDK